jgi:hypothetical protein
MQETPGDRRFWSDLEVFDLRSALKSARPLHQIVTDLSRDVEEIQAKIVELSDIEDRIRAIAVEQLGEATDEIADGNPNPETAAESRDK